MSYKIFNNFMALNVGISETIKLFGEMCNKCENGYQLRCFH